MNEQVSAVICALNSQYIHSSLAPWCLLAGVTEYCSADICATVVEGTVNEEQEKVLERILCHNPKVVGFCCYIWNITVVNRVIQLLKQEKPDMIIVLGGPEVSYHARGVLQGDPLVDYLISGEGERPFAQLLDSLSNGTDPQGIPGLCYRKGEQVVLSEPYTPCETPPSPYSEAYFSALQGRIAYLETSRGCPFSCAFCLSGRCGGVRYYDLERAKSELLLLAKSGTQTIKLVDRTFNANRERAKELFRFIIEHYGKEIPTGICFHFEIGGDLLDEETLALLKTAPLGSMQFEIGVQSFHAETLAKINRTTNMDKLRHNISALLENKNTHVHIDLIAGLPLEDMKTFQDSFEKAFTLRPHMLQLGFLKLLHGAPMREERDLYPCEFDRNPPYAVSKTPWITEEELSVLQHTEHALDRLYNRGRFRRTLAYLLEHMETTAFGLFSDFGAFLEHTERAKKSLDDLIALVYFYFSAQKGVDVTMLRDCMVCDRLATNAMGKLPPVLRIEDPRLKAEIKAYEWNHERKKGVKRGYALLYGEGCLVYAEYQEKNPVTGEYELIKIPLRLQKQAN